LTSAPLSIASSSEVELTDSVSTFFDDLARRGHVDLLEKAEGTLRIELADGKKSEHRLIEFEKGNISVSRRNARGDCAFRTDRALFAKIVRGEANAVTAVLRGDAAAEGDLELLFLLQRVFPAAPRPREPRRGAGGAGRRA
jgi:putative sterol carrier protein